MPGSSSWMPYASQGVKGFDYDDDELRTTTPLGTFKCFKILYDIVQYQFLQTTSGKRYCHISCDCFGSQAWYGGHQISHPFTTSCGGTQRTRSTSKNHREEKISCND